MSSYLCCHVFNLDRRKKDGPVFASCNQFDGAKDKQQNKNVIKQKIDATCCRFLLFYAHTVDMKEIITTKNKRRGRGGICRRHLPPFKCYLKNDEDATLYFDSHPHLTLHFIRGSVFLLFLFFFCFGKETTGAIQEMDFLYVTVLLECFKSDISTRRGQ